MSTEKKKTQQPKVRFPEFRDKPGWELNRLGLVLKFQAGFPFSSSGFNDEGMGLRLIRNRDLRSDDIVKFYSEDFDPSFIVKNGDVLVGMDGDFTPTVWGKGEALLNQRVGRVLPIGDTHHRFLLHVLELCLKGIEEATARTTVKHLSHSAIENKHEPLPAPKEQQKIADCLSSLDELIAAQARKVDALKTHKKGLMQQLFPREGETQPRLRFPEFQNAGEWVSEELSSCLKKVIDYRGIAPPKSESGIPLITAKNVRFGWLDMTNDEYIEEDKYAEWMSRGIPHAGDILFTTEAPLGNVALFLLSGKFALGQRLLTLRSKPERCESAFLFQSLLGPTMQAEINFHGTGSTAKGIKSKVFLKLNFCHPNLQEQQRIAACLNSLDTLIATANQELDTLRAHKKGLMQQLFPCPKKD